MPQHATHLYFREYYYLHAVEFFSGKSMNGLYFEKVSTEFMHYSTFKFWDIHFFSL
jgi:hypothetical protein